MQEKLEARRYYVSGMVQGVGFRFFASGAASRLGVAGYVKNLRDGRVEIYAIGRREQLAGLRAELERGPRWATVEEVAEDAAPIEPRFADRFSIEHDDW